MFSEHHISRMLMVRLLTFILIRNEHIYDFISSVSHQLLTITYCRLKMYVMLATMNVSGPLVVSSPSGPSVNVSGPLVSSPTGPSVNVSGPLVSSPSGPCATGPLMNLCGPPMSSPSALNVSSSLASSPSGPHQLVHIPFSPHLPSNLPSRNRSPLSNLPVQIEIPQITGKAKLLTSAECVQALKNKERKKQEEAEQKAKCLEEWSQKKKQKEEELRHKKE